MNKMLIQDEWMEFYFKIILFLVEEFKIQKCEKELIFQIMNLFK